METTDLLLALLLIAVTTGLTLAGAWARGLRRDMESDRRLAIADRLEHREEHQMMWKEMKQIRSDAEQAKHSILAHIGTKHNMRP